MNNGLNAGLKALEAIATLVSIQTKGRWSSWYKVGESRSLIEKTCAEGIAELQTELIKVLNPFQMRVRHWMHHCFGPVISRDVVERNHRYLEESLELVQACGCTEEEAHHLVRYVFSRPVGEKVQEVGGVMVTLGALCEAQGIDMVAAGEVELRRINIPETMEKIRAKQAAKPKYSALPM